MAKEVTVTLTPGSITTGLWCDVCQLPSRIVVPVLWITENGVNTLSVVDRCVECGCAP